MNEEEKLPMEQEEKWEAPIPSEIEGDGEMMQGMLIGGGLVAGVMGLFWAGKKVKSLWNKRKKKKEEELEFDDPFEDPTDKEEEFDETPEEDE